MFLILLLRICLWRRKLDDLSGRDQLSTTKTSKRDYLRPPCHTSLGWTEAAMIAGARVVGVSPAIIGSFPRKEAALVEYFMDDWLQRLIDRIDSGEDLQNLIPSQCISKLIKISLEMQAPYISKWPQALSIQVPIILPLFLVKVLALGGVLTPCRSAIPLSRPNP
ncbi:ubiquinone biosynthesis protein COQ9, mitochondrial-like [Mangifera indica]|uniref:ubiquinone biosynthesis protein COQ9, mitochondrial-like n=1 Tax=Mangifera indica TaxID=29780 RepID=UPI001CFBD8D1|nr:ubiquinone biosynthesis protein COQ9, mitochondrial-like [Mangifera indica]XP_044471278.1 ubiquinone biosynthesis protein COQ9, mitochondrial-like [Mangifera indica]XP_044471279.1 ubiquinone biosynthesis protein COQ9, mitochondrial-like [Mangifera indica]